MAAYDVFAAAAETDALKVSSRGAKHLQLVYGPGCRRGGGELSAARAAIGDRHLLAPRRGRRGTIRLMSATTAQSEAIDVILRDGSTLRLRAPLPADRRRSCGSTEGFRTAASTSIPRPPYDRRTSRRPVLDPDWLDRGALMGSVVQRRGTVVALAIYVRLRRPPRRSRVHGGGHRPAPASELVSSSTRRRCSRRSASSIVGEMIEANSAMIGVLEDGWVSRSPGRSTAARSR